jgi:hypothetical protein
MINTSDTSDINKPAYYQGASEIGIPALKCLGYTRFDGDCCEETEARNQWILASAYLFLAAKYLWRLGDKDDAVKDLEKTKWYLNRVINLSLSTMMERECASECLKQIELISFAQS